MRAHRSLFSSQQPCWLGVCVVLGLMLGSGPAAGERVFFAGYKGGFYIKSEEAGGMELRLGGALQSDYRYFAEEARADNGFDVRRARLVFRGTLTRYFRFGMEYEFQGNEPKNLVDAYGEAVMGSHGLRFGQFKEPFSLETQTRDKGLLFAERSMGYWLSPRRDIGLMLHGGLLQDRIRYGLGVFDGNGVDGDAGGTQADDPEFAARLVLRPFGLSEHAALRGIQVGASATHAAIEMANVDLTVKSTGMAGTGRSLYSLRRDTKFGVLQDVDTRVRTALEAAWTWGPLVLQGEYSRFAYTDLTPVGSPARDADLDAWYVSAAWCLTGEQPALSQGTVKPIYPDRFFDPAEGHWGAVVLAARVEHFSGDAEWIQPTAFVSVESADAVSVALNWILFPMQRFIVDYSHTALSDPLRVRVQPDGRVDYIDEENVVTVRFSIDF